MANNNNKKMEEIFSDLGEWLTSELGKNARQHDNFNEFKEETGFGSMLDLGKRMHNVPNSLKKVDDIFRKLGCSFSAKALPKGEGTEFCYTRDGEVLGKFTISATEDGYTSVDGQLSANIPMYVRAQNGEVGLASSISVGLDEAARQMETYFDFLNRTLKQNSKKGAAKVRSIFGNAFRSVTTLDPRIYSTNQIKDLSNFDQKNLRSRRLESAEAGKIQAITAFYEASLYRGNKAFNGSGAPSQKNFTRQLDDIINKARGFSSFEALEQEVRRKYPWIYNNIWKGDVENFIRPLIGKITQGGMTEGTVGRISFKEPDVAFGNLAASGKKPTQNLQVLKQNSKYLRGSKTVASGSLRLFSETQRKMWDKKIKQGHATINDMLTDVYTGGELTDEDISKAISKILKEDNKKKNLSKEERQLLTLMGSKGFGDDASFISMSLAKEWQGKYDKKKLKDGEYRFADANEFVRQSLLSKYKRSLKHLLEVTELKDDEKKEISDLENMINLLNREDVDVRMEDEKGNRIFKEAESKIKKFLKQKYNLTGKENIQSYNVNEEGFFSDVYKSTQRFVKNSVLRNVIGDTRTNASSMHDLVMGMAFEMHGYRPSEIWEDPKNRTGLKMHFAQQAGKDLGKKTIRTDVNGSALYIFNELRKKGLKDEDIKKSFRDNRLLNQLFKVEDGMLLTKNDVLSGMYKGGNQEVASQLLQAIAQWGQSTGVLDANAQYFREIDFAEEAKKLTEEGIQELIDAELIKKDDEGNIKGKKMLVQTKAMPMAYGLGISSPTQWSGGPKDTHSRAKMTWREYQSALSTYGDFRNFLLDQLDNKNINKEEYEARIAPFQNWIHNLTEGMHEKEEEYDKYVKNAKYLQNTFKKEQQETVKRLRNDKNVILLTAGEIAALDASIDYENDFIGTDEFDRKNQSKKAAIYLRNKAADYYDRLNEEQRKEFGVSSVDKFEQLSNTEKDKFLQSINFGLDLGQDEKLKGFVDGNYLESQIIMLGLGSYLEGAAKDGKYAVDDIMRGNLNIIEAVQDYLQGSAIDKDLLNNRALRVISGTHQAFGESYRNGPIYEKTHTLVNEASGYLLLQGQNEEIVKNLNRYLNEKYGRGSEVTKKTMEGLKKQDVSIMNTHDFIQILEAQMKESEEAREKIENLYYSLSGENRGKKLRIETLAEKVANFYDISSKDFKGEFIESALLNRNPTINFNNDLIGSGLLLTSKDDIVEKGNIMVRRSFAGLGKGDMDGDLMAFQNALLTGDVGAATEAITAYYQDYSDNMQKIFKEAEAEKKTKQNIVKKFLKNKEKLLRLGEIDDINSVLDETGKKVTASAMWSGKAGAGIWGDEKFAAEAIMDRLHLGGMNRQDRNITALGARTWAAVYQSLYQEGINIKNLKGKDWENMSKDEQAAALQNLIDETLVLSGQAKTWDDESTTNYFFDNLKKMGILNEDKMFKENTLVNLGLKDIKKGSEELDDLERVVKNTRAALIESSGKDSEQVKRIEKDLENIKKLQNGQIEKIDYISRETAIGLIRNFFNAPGLFSKDYTAGMMMEDRYKSAIPGKSNKEIPLLGIASGLLWDEETRKALEAMGYKTSEAINNTREIGAYEKAILRGEEDPETKRFEPYWTTTTSQLHTKIAKPSDPIDFETLALTKEYLNPLTPAERKREILNLRNAWHQPEFIEKSIPALKAITRGTISHRMAEILDKDNLKDFSTEDAFKYFKENYGDELKDWDAYIKFAFDEFKAQNSDDKDEVARKAEARQKFVKDSLIMGAENFQAILDKMKAEGGVRIGSELPLAGMTGIDDKNTYQYVRQIADFMYYTADEETKRKIIHLVDWKNNASGDPKLENIFQGKDYVLTMKNLARDIEKVSRNGSGETTTLVSYLGKQTAAGKAYDELLRAMADYDSGYGGGDPNDPKLRNKNRNSKAWNEAYQARLKDASALFDILKEGNVGFAFDLIINNGKGVIGDYEVDLNNPLLVDTFFDYYKKEGINLTDYLGTKKSDIDALIKTSLKSRNFTFNGSERKAEALFKPENEHARTTLDSFYDAYKDYAKIEREIMRLQRIPDRSAKEQEKLSILVEQKDELLKKIGKQTDYDEAQKEISEIDKLKESLDINDESKNYELRRSIQEKQERVNELISSLYYKRTKAYKELGSNVLYNSGGMAIAVGGALSQDLDIYDSYKLNEIEKEIKQDTVKDARTNIVEDVKSFKKWSSEASKLRAATADPMLTEAAKKEAEENAAMAEAIRDRYAQFILEETKKLGKKSKSKKYAINGYRFVDEEGKNLTIDQLKEMGWYVDVEGTKEKDKKLAEEEQKRLNYVHQKGLETKAIQFYQDLYKQIDRRNEIRDKLEDARLTGDEDEVKYLEEEEKRASGLLQAYAKLHKTDILDVLKQSEEGKAILTNSMNYVRLQRKTLKSSEEKATAEAAKRAAQGGGAAGGAGGFLGIDSATTHWLSRLMNGGLIYSFIRLVRRGLRDITNQAKQLDQAMTNLRIVTGKNASDARTLISQYSELGKQLGATTIEITQSATAWLRQGYDISQVNDLIKSSMYLSKLGMIDSAEATKNLTSALHGFKLEASQAMDVVDKLTALDVKAATTAGDIAQGLSQFANIANLGGVSIDQAAAYVATIADVNQMSGITVGQSLNFYGDLRG